MEGWGLENVRQRVDNNSTSDFDVARARVITLISRVPFNTAIPPQSTSQAPPKSRLSLLVIALYTEFVQLGEFVISHADETKINRLSRAIRIACMHVCTYVGMYKIRFNVSQSVEIIAHSSLSTLTVPKNYLPLPIYLAS